MVRRNGRDSALVFDTDTKLEIGSAMSHYAGMDDCISKEPEKLQAVIIVFYLLMCESYCSLLESLNTQRL